MAARRTARPRPGRRIPTALFGARLQARTRPSAARALASAPATGGPTDLARFKRHLLATFRRDGSAVPTPVWVAVAGGRGYVRTERRSGKVRRLARDPRVVVAPCDARGRPTGAAMRGTARLLGPEEEAVAEAALARRYGLGRVLFELVVDLRRVDMAYLEIAPDAQS